MRTGWPCLLVRRGPSKTSYVGEAMILDVDLNSLTSFVNLIDDRIAALHDSPESFELVVDNLEYMTGLGFVACQGYLTATMGCVSDKAALLACGPKHRTGESMATLVNACANFWKHCDEWPENKLSPAQQRTADRVGCLGINRESSYPMATALGELVDPQRPRFAGLLDCLTRWRVELHAQQSA